MGFSTLGGVTTVSADVEEDGEAKEPGSSPPSELKEEVRVEVLEIRRLSTTSVSLLEDPVEDEDHFFDEQGEILRLFTAWVPLLEDPVEDADHFLDEQGEIRRLFTTASVSLLEDPVEDADRFLDEQGEVWRLFTTGSVAVPEDPLEDTDRALDEQEHEQEELDEERLPHEDSSSLRRRHFTAEEGNAIASLPISRAEENGT